MNKQELCIINRTLLSEIRTCSDNICKRYPVGYADFKKITEKLMKLINNLYECEEYKAYVEKLSVVFEILLKAIESGDWIYVTDILKEELMGCLRYLHADLIDNMVGEDYFENNLCFISDKSKIPFIKSQDTSGFEIIYSEDGYPIVYSNTENIHFSSMISPANDASVLADSIIRTDCENYVIYGMTNPYIPFEILKKHPFSKIVVIENNAVFIKLGLTVCDFTSFIQKGDEDRFRVVYAPDLPSVLAELNCKASNRTFIDTMAVKMAIDTKVKEAMSDIAVKTDAIREQSFYMYANFWHLQHKKLREFSELKGCIKGKKTYVVAAGPSLDDMIEVLKNREEDSRIVCVGTVIRKLLNDGIRPDLAIIIDATPFTLEQINGIENETIPLVLFSTANAVIADRYKGPIYIAYQKDFDMSEGFASRNGYITFEAGGSVSGAALQLAVLNEAKEIILVGFDLAFPKGRAYASETGREEYEKSTDTNLLVKSTTGIMISTIGAFKMYREWIERFLETHEHPPVYNTGEGSQIKGTTLICD